jgi:hypothetical protein
MSLGLKSIKRDDRTLDVVAKHEMFYRNLNQGASVNDGALQGAQGTDLNEMHRNSSNRRGYRTLESDPAVADLLLQGA